VTGNFDQFHHISRSFGSPHRKISNLIGDNRKIGTGF
jgi:hypothetical protein